MSKSIDFLKENYLIYLATSRLDGNAKVRYILFYFEEYGKPYFSTSNNKSMFKELDVNPNCEMIVATPKFAWLRIAGKVEFKCLLELKQKVIDSNELVKLYETHETHVFEVFTVH